MSDQQPAAGWYPDPRGSFEQRYWDGQTWTQWVIADGAQSEDPDWVSERTSTGPTGTAPSGSAPGPGSSLGGSSVAVVPPKERLREQLQRPRPPASVQSALAAVAGVIALIGLVLILEDFDNDVGIGFIGVAIVAVGYGAALFGPRQSRAVGLPAVVVGPAIVVGAWLPEGIDGRWALVIPAVLLAVAWAGMFVAPGFTGAPILLVGVILAGWGAIVGLIASDADDRYYYEPGPMDWAQQSTSAVGTLSVIFAIVCVVAAGLADRGGWRVLATPLIASAVIIGYIGTTTASSAGQSNEMTAVLAIGFGSILLAVGVAGNRRGSVWLGAVTAASGIVGLLLLVVLGDGQGSDPFGPPTDGRSNEITAGVLLMVAAAALYVTAPIIERAIVSRASTDEAEPVEI